VPHTMSCDIVSARLMEPQHEVDARNSIGNGNGRQTSV